MSGRIPFHFLNKGSLSLLSWVRRFLIAGCLLASALALWQLGDVRASLQRDRLAADAFARGMELETAGLRADAVAAFQLAVSYGPADADLYELSALAQFRLGRIDDSIETYRRLLRAYPYAYVGALYRDVGLIELRAGRVDAAREDLLRAVELDPVDWLAYHLLGHARKRSGDLIGAKEAWERALDLNPGFQPAREQLRAIDEKQ